MSDLASSSARVEGWLQPLPDDAAPCGPDLEYDNAFLELNLAMAGRPETQFSAAEPPDWRAAFERAAALLDRARDLRLAIAWLRAGLHVQGFAFLPVGLKLLDGLVERLWDHVHPLPDPDDGDPYPRVNALAVLADAEGLITDLRSVRVLGDRAVGELTVREVEIALGQLPPRADEQPLTREQIERMLQAALERAPALREAAQSARDALRQLMARLNDRLGEGAAPDLRPLYRLLNGLLGLFPAADAGAAAAAAGGDAAGGAEGAAGDGGRPVPARSLSGAVNSRADAVRAIEMICQYLERAEPSNPAPLFLRRARQLIDHNFLQLMKELAPDALNEVARTVGVDPDTIDVPPAS